MIDLYETTIEGLHSAYRAGTLSPVTVVTNCLRRIAAFDRSGAALNAMVVLNPDALADAEASEQRFRDGTERPLEGIPFTVKDSYMVAGLTVASGSPAFQHLVAQWNAFSAQRLLDAGAVLIGKTNMPPMADGGMQRGVYGRAENPYNPAYLAAAYASGSSNGSGVATAANFAVIGMGEETVSSGRSPASNNGLCAFTPSWGLISIRGNWPLFPARDVVVPHTRTMDDMLRTVDVLVADDNETRGDFWRHQAVIDIPPASELRPESFREVALETTLAGKRFAVPRMYLGEDEAFPIAVRESILERFREAVAQLEVLGAEVIETDFPLIEQYEGDNPGGENVDRLGVLPDGWMTTEFTHFLPWGWDEFLRANGDPQVPSLDVVDPDTIFPLWPGTLPDRYEEIPNYEERYRDTVAFAKSGIPDPREREDFAAGLRALHELRERLFDQWLDEHELDGVIFPANADVAAADADVDQVSNDRAWENGVLFSNGNYALRHLGIPTVTVPMGVMDDTGVPVGLTFAGKAYTDAELLGYATAYDRAAEKRESPLFAPRLLTDLVTAQGDALDAGALGVSASPSAEGTSIVLTGVSWVTAPEGSRAVEITGTVGDAEELLVTVNGEIAAVERIATGSDADSADTGGTLTQWIGSAVVGPLPVSENPLHDRLLIVAEARHGSSVAADCLDIAVQDETDAGA